MCDEPAFGHVTGKIGRRAMDIDDDATQHSDDSQIWMGVGIDR